MAKTSINEDEQDLVIPHPTTQSESIIQPIMVVSDSWKALAFYEKVFGAKKIWHLMHYHRVGHMVISIGRSEVAILDEFPESGILAPPLDGSLDKVRNGARLTMEVPDVDKVIAAATEGGATILRQPSDEWWGVRGGSFRDPFGYTWAIRSKTNPMTIKEVQEKSDEMDLYPPPKETVTA